MTRKSKFKLTDILQVLQVHVKPELSGGVFQASYISAHYSIYRNMVVYSLLALLSLGYAMTNDLPVYLRVC